MFLIRLPGLMPVIQLIDFSHESMKVVKRNFIFSLFYNGIGAVGAIAGFMNPFVAALLMPLSALTVFVSSIVGTKKMRMLLREGGVK